MSDTPEIQMIAQAIVEDRDGRILLARYDEADDTDDSDEERRWFIPAHELEPYEHPDDAARTALDEIVGVSVEELGLHSVQSFRGRRGWHVMFDYRGRADGEPDDGDEAAWFERDSLPATKHGKWERDTIDRVLTAPVGSVP